MAKHVKTIDNSEMRQFKMDCPMCAFPINLIEFPEHLKAEITKYEISREAKLEELLRKAMMRNVISHTQKLSEN